MYLFDSKPNMIRVRFIKNNILDIPFPFIHTHDTKKWTRISMWINRLQFNLQNRNFLLVNKNKNPDAQ